MNHHERSGDASGGRKTVYPLSLPKRESGGGGVMGGSSTSGSSSLNTNNVLVEDYAPAVLSQTQTTATGSQNPPQSLSIPLQPTMMPAAVAQMKKKSGFQITSVTPAQTSVSNNNSITEDTESCDDLDESHTEDLSSSEILDVSLSRVNNAGGPERSSSEETLNNFHEAETPGAVSPNQPPLHAQTHPHGVMVNGAVHHHHHHQNSQHATSAKPRQAVMGGGGTSIGMPLAVTSAVTSVSAALTSSTVQKMPSKVVGIVENASVGTVIGTVASGSGLICSAVSTGKLSTAGMLSSACVPSVGGIGTSTASVNYSGISNQNVNLTQSGMTGVDSLTSMALAGGGQVGTALPGGSAHPPQAQVPPPASTSSRFRVVKLDSTSEPFKKGRWTCTEYYDKEAPENARTVESARQIVPDSATGPDKEGVSVSSYTESHGSGETGGPAVPQQAFHPQDALHLKTNTPVPGSHPQTVVLQTTVGHSSPHLPKLTYAQAAQSPAVTQQQMGFPAQAPPAHVSLPPDFTQAKQIVSLPASTQALPHLPATIPPVAGSGQLVSPLPPGLFQTPAPQLVQASAAGVPPQLIPQVQATQGLPMTHQFSVELQQGRANQYVPPATSAPNLQGDLQPIQNGSQEPGVSARPAVMPLEDARLLLLQHPALLIQTKPGESSQSAASRCPDAGVNVLTASASLLKSLPVDGEDDGSSGASVVAIDNKIEQAMDLVKSHLMYAVREEVEVLKEQIKELIERNSQLEQENSLLKNLASPEQLAQFQAQVQSGSPVGPPPAPSAQSSGPSA